MATFTNASGDILETTAQYKVNTVNCVGVMGAGLALQFKTAYPEMFLEYKNLCDQKIIRPGVLSIWHSLGIINFPTKDDWRKPSEYEYIALGLKTLGVEILKYKMASIAIPPLGCGLGGLDLKIVDSMIRLELKECNCEIQLYYK